MKLKVSRKAHFNAAQRLYKKQWDDAKNLEVFGKCSNPNFHGHNYELIVSVTGEVDPETSCVIDLKVLTQLVQREIEEHLSHKSLNIKVEEFKHLNHTVANIDVVIYNRLKPHLKDFELEIILYETPR